jgi:4'-phosphopantetheinyl transferase EntD
MPLDPERLQKFQELQNKNQKERLIEWVNARKAELEVRSMLGTDGGMLSLSHTRFSVSTNEMAVTVAVGLRASTQTERPRIVGVGVDLESTDRMPSQKVVDRIVQKSERAWLDSGQIQALGFWTMKEAAFKATPSNLGSMISDFVISSWDPSTRVATVTSPLLLKQNLSCRAMILTGMGLTVAMALAFEINAERIR